MPTEKYFRWYQAFYVPRRVAQMVISHAMKRRQMGFDSFVHGVLNNSISIFGDRFEEGDLWASVRSFLSSTFFKT
jgi:DNA (cytosine-5)-methyltransferase 1